MTDAPAEAPAQEPTQEPQEPAKPETDWKAEARKWEARAKENAEARKELEPLKAQMEGIAAVFGHKPEEKGEDLAATVQQLQQQFQQAQWATAVEAAARRNGITLDADMELLRSAPNEEALARLAERLKPSTALPPDPGQGARESSPDDDEYLKFYPRK